MSKRIKLYWDFRGPVSEGTARHYEMHLNEYFRDHQLPFEEVGHLALGDQQHSAYAIIAEGELPRLKQDLRPHRGEWV